MSRLTSKYQATIPRAVREALNLNAGDRIEFLTTGKQVRVRKYETPDLADARADDAMFSPEWLSAADEAAWHDL